MSCRMSVRQSLKSVNVERPVICAADRRASRSFLGWRSLSHRLIQQSTKVFTALPSQSVKIRTVPYCTIQCITRLEISHFSNSAGWCQNTTVLYVFFAPSPLPFPFPIPSWQGPFNSGGERATTPGASHAPQVRCIPRN